MSDFLPVILGTLLAIGVAVLVIGFFADFVRNNAVLEGSVYGSELLPLCSKIGEVVHVEVRKYGEQLFGYCDVRLDSGVVQEFRFNRELNDSYWVTR